MFKRKTFIENGVLQINLPHAIFTDAIAAKALLAVVGVFSIIDCQEKHIHF
jgi:hypothetical protein